MMGSVHNQRSLRRRLFGSHLLVMVIALGVLFLVVGAVALLFDVASQREISGAGGRGGPLGPIVGLVAAVVASAFVSWRVSRRLAGPLEQISVATRQLAAGEYGVRVPRADTAEFDALASDVNQLAHELESTEHRRLRLIGDVAHELRNPLSTIEGTMEALLDGVIAADADTFSRVGREAARLRRLAEDLSSLSLAGELGSIDGAPVDLTAVVADVVAQLEPQVAAKGLTINTVAPSQVEVLGDRDRLTQVLTNVVGNALQYSDEGTITVGVGAEESNAVIEVSDTGRGLSVADQGRIFERFYRVDEHISDGTGVGLAIAKLIVDAHGGSISATSAGLRHGTTISIVLPISRTELTLS